MSVHSRMRIACVLVPALVLAALTLTACGSSSSSSSSEATSGETSASTGESSRPTTVESSYDGPENNFVTPFPTPTKKSGTDFRVGYLQIIGAIPQVATLEAGAAEEIKNLGGSIISVDAELDIQKQVAGFEQLLAQNVDAIIGYPVAAKALGPQLAKAEAAGIPVVTAGSQGDVTKPLESGILADVGEALDFEAYETMKALSEQAPGAPFVTMGLAAPVESLEYLVGREQYWGKKFGLKFEGEIDTKEDNPEAYSAAATAILGKYPNTKIITTYSELAALSAATVAQTSARTDLLITGGNGGAESGIEAVKAGKLFSVYAIPWREIGQEIARGAYDAVTKQGLPLPERVSARGTLVTADNVDEVEPTVEG